MAFSGIAAIATASATGAAITGTMVLAAVANVGTILTVVGAVTGSKDLLKIGGAMSLIGGVGGAIAGAANGAATAAAAEGAASGAASSTATASLSDAIGATVPTEAAVSAAGDGLASSLAPFQTAGPAVASPVTTGGQGLISQSLPPPATTPTPAAATPSSLPGAPTVQGATGPANVGDRFLASYDDLYTGQAATSAFTNPLGQSGGPVPSTSWWSNLSDGTKNAIVKTGSGLLQGLSQASSARDAAAQRREEMNMRYGHANAVPRGIINKAAAA